MSSPGTLVSGRYRLHRMLGEGGMGAVWSATDERLRRKVAVKVLKERPRGAETAAATGPDAERLRLLREARAACAVRHPGVVEVLDVVDDETPLLVMELLATPV